MDLKCLAVLTFVVSYVISFNTTLTEAENWSSTEIVKKMFVYTTAGEEIAQYLVDESFKNTTKMADVEKSEVNHRSLANEINSTNHSSDEPIKTKESHSRTVVLTEKTKLSPKTEETAILTEEITITLSPKTEETITLTEDKNTENGGNNNTTIENEETTTLTEEITAVLPAAEVKMTILPVPRKMNGNIISNKENNEKTNNIVHDRTTISPITEKIIMTTIQETTEGKQALPNF